MKLTDIERLEELEKKATPGEWSCRQSGMFEDSYSIEGIVRSHNHTPYVRKDDAELIAAARNALPALIRDWKRLRETVEFYAYSNKVESSDPYCGVWEGWTYKDLDKKPIEFGTKARECLKEMEDK